MYLFLEEWKQLRLIAAKQNSSIHWILKGLIQPELDKLLRKHQNENKTIDSG